MNNKILIISAMLVLGGVTWYGYSTKATDISTTSTRLDTFAHSLELSYPKSWGSITGDSIQKNFLPGDFPDIRRFIFSSYPNKSQTASTGLIIQEYATKFVNDAVNPEDPWWSSKTATEKNKIIQPLFTIYRQKSVVGIPLINFGNEATQNPNNTLGGWWWGNESAFQHRMNVTYLGNQTGDLRGVGYFSNSGQDVAFFPAYTVILINPTKRVVIEGTFSVSNLPELSKWIPSEANGNGSIQQGQLTAQGEAYLNNPSNYSAKLTDFVSTIQAIVSSMTLMK